MTVQPGVNAGESTCPLCGRFWLVTPSDDCLMPACGHFGHDATATNPNRPCQPCGLKHAFACKQMGGDGVERTEPVKVVEVRVWGKGALN